MDDKLPESKCPQYNQLPNESVPDWILRRARVAKEEGRECLCGLVSNFGESSRFSLSHAPGCPAHHDNPKFKAV